MLITAWYFLLSTGIVFSSDARTDMATYLYVSGQSI